MGRFRYPSPFAWLSAALFVLSLASVLALLPWAASSDYAIGKHKLAFFIPPFSAMLFLALGESVGKRPLARPLYPLLFMFALMLPLVSLWNQALVYHVGDDSYLYSRYAHYISSQLTLEGGPDHIPFVNQILIRYLFALEFLLLGSEIVAIQIINLVVFFATLTTLYFTYRPHLSKNYRLVLIVGLLLITPYSIKNVLSGYNEWLALSLMFCFFMWHDHPKLSCLAYACLGLAPIARMNLLLVVFVLAGYEAIRKRLTLTRFAVLAATLSLPLVHNVYFYGEWTYLTAGGSVGIPIHDPAALMNGFPVLVEFLARRALQYVGYPFTTYNLDGIMVDTPDQDIFALGLGAIFLPYFLCSILYFAYSLKGAERAWFLLAGAALVGPTLVFGSGNFPRFQYVNVVILFAYYFVLTGADAEVKRVQPT